MSVSASSALEDRPATAVPDTRCRRWVRGYRREWLVRDLVAGVTLAAYLIPAGIADASLANLPPEAGLYACLFAGLVFWMFCSSRHTSITVTSAISLLTGATLAELAGGDPARLAAMAAATALLVAMIALAAWAIRAGAIVNFISEPVMVGFKCGVALVLVGTQLPKLLGLKGAHGSFWERCAFMLDHGGETHLPSLIVGGVALVLLIAGKIWLRNRPVALGVVILGIMASPWMELEQRGVKLLGAVPHGVPVPGVPSIQLSDINELLPLAVACFLLGAVETAAIGRMFAMKHGGRLDPNREFLALAAANLAAGLGRGFPVSGGMSQSIVNEGGGARTPLSGLFASLILLAVVLWFSGLLRNLPQPVLAAVVLVAVGGLLQPRTLLHLWKVDRPEFAAAIGTLVGVLGSGLLRGVMFGALISLIQLIRRAARPHVAVLGRIPGTSRFSDMQRHPENEPIPDGLLVRPQAGLVYFNIGHVCDTILERTRASRAKFVVLDLSAAPYIDLQSVEALATLADELLRQGVAVHAVDARAVVRDRLRLAGADEKLGGVNRFNSIADVVGRYETQRTAVTSEPVGKP